MRFGHFFVTSYAINYVTATLYNGKFCPLACELTLNYVTFNDTDAWLSKKVQSCKSALRTTSLYLCFDRFCERETDIDVWIQGQRPWCEQHAAIILPAFHDIVDKWSSDDKAAARRLEVEEALNLTTQNDVIIPSDAFFHRAFVTMDVAFSEYDLHRVYGWYMHYFWIVVVALGIGTRLISLIMNVETRNQNYQIIPSPDSQHPVARRHILDRLRVWLKYYLTTPALFGNRCSRPYGWCTIPPRLQSLTIFAFIAFNVVLCVCSYHLTEGNLYWPQKSAQLLRYVSDRTGIISLANFPLVWLFGMRNDLLIWITGWGFGTYNAFHRWAARVATLQAVIHSIGYTLMILESGGWSSFLKYLSKHYFWNGELATIAMCALLAFSFYGIRRAHYEVFLITHIVLSVVALWTMYYHVEIFTDGEWNIFIWPCLVIWILDRCLRLARILAFNRNPSGTIATASYDPNSNLVRMDVDGRQNWILPKPGTYYYIHVLNDLAYAHQNHPFTLAFTSPTAISVPPTPLSPLSSRPPAVRTQTSSSRDSSESDALLAPEAKNLPADLVFLIRPYDGFTSRLKRHCLLRPKKLRVLVDGPYGHTVPLRTFEHILFVVGGTGIAVPMSHLTHLLSAGSRVQSIKIVWAVREYAFLTSMLRDFRGLLADERMEMEVHITRDEEAKDDVLGSEFRSVRIMTHRPDVMQTVQDAAQDAGKQTLAVVACGPALMADQARKASVQMLGRGYGGIEYFEESFKW